MVVCSIALISCFIVPIDKGYIDYFDGAAETLTCIFGILIIVAGLENIDFFKKLQGF